MIEFDFLKKMLRERRSYYYSAFHFEMVSREVERLSALYPKSDFVLPEDGPVGSWGGPSLTVSHMLAPPSNGAKIIEETFSIRLPSDFLAFYSLWNEGLLLVRNPIKILAPKDILELTAEIRDAQQAPYQLPFHTIRFGELNPSFHYALRFDSIAKDWEVALCASDETRDVEFQSLEYESCATDKTFTAWLHRMLDTDGAPLDSHYPDDPDDFFNQRVA